MQSGLLPYRGGGGAQEEPNSHGEMCRATRLGTLVTIPKSPTDDSRKKEEMGWQVRLGERTRLPGLSCHWQSTPARLHFVLS